MCWASLGLRAVTLTIFAPLCAAFTDSSRLDAKIAANPGIPKSLPPGATLNPQYDVAKDPETQALYEIGLIMLDNYTIRKMIGVHIATPDHGLLIRYYAEDSKPHGGKEHDPLHDLVKNLNHIHHLTIAEFIVPYADHVLTEGYSIREEFDIEHDDLPTYTLYSKKFPTGVHYHGHETFKDIALWLHVKGGFEIEHETIEDLNKVVKYFMKESDNEAKIKHINKAMAIATEIGIESAIYYPKYMHKVMEKGTPWIRKESERLRQLMHQKLPPDARSELSDKFKILSQFLKAAKDYGAEL